MVCPHHYSWEERGISKTPQEPHIWRTSTKPPVGFSSHLPLLQWFIHLPNQRFPWWWVYMFGHVCSRVCTWALSVAFTAAWGDKSVISLGRGSAATNANDLLLNKMETALPNTHTHTFPGKSRYHQTLQETSGAIIISLPLTFVSTAPLWSHPSSPDTSQLARVTLTSALISSGRASPSAPWVESCSCPPGFTGQFCEQCSPGFTRQHPGRGPLSPCVPCNCHQHGTCHQETGNALKHLQWVLQWASAQHFFKWRAWKKCYERMMTLHFYP